MTPMRISFIGGGSDIKDFYQKSINGGAVIFFYFNPYNIKEKQYLIKSRNLRKN